MLERDPERIPPDFKSELPVFPVSSAVDNLSGRPWGGFPLRSY